MTLIRAHYDGNAVLPEDNVNLPVGTPVDVYVPHAVHSPSAEENDEWDEIVREIATTEPAFPTVDDALNHTRGRG
jgi:hypothetical protein